MKKIYAIIVLAMQSCLMMAAQPVKDISDAEIQIAVQAQKTKKVTFGIIVLGHEDKCLAQCVERLQKDLEWSGQVNVAVQRLVEMKYIRDLKNIFPSSISIAVVVSKSGCDVTWRLYDVSSAKMIVGKTIDQTQMPISMVAHTIADELWLQLFGQSSSFRSKIAYSKQIWRTKYGKEKPYKQIWIADFDGSNAHLFIDAPTVSFASRWSNDPSCPLLFYSQNTLSNVQLVMSNMFGKRKVVCSFDGLNMQPTFSDDGKKVVFCLSKDGSSQLYLSYINPVSQQRVFDRLTYNTGNNIAPCFVDQTHVAFVSDYQTHKPQIYMLDLKTKVVTQVTDGGYCACPSYSSVRKKLLYSKMMGPVMQLFTYDLATGAHQQLTTTPGSKEEGTWSVCGNYIAFGLNQGMSSRIAQLHLPTNSIRFLTKENEHCTYPDCSPIYRNCIGILQK